MSKPSNSRLALLAGRISALVLVAAVAFLVVAHSGSTTKNLVSVASTPLATAHPVSAKLTPAAHDYVSVSTTTLPLAFESNQGQDAPQVKYIARGNGYKLSLTSTSAVMTLRKGRLDSPVLRTLQHKRLGATGTQRMLEKQRNAPAVNTASPAVAELRMKMLGASPQTRLSAAGRQPGKVNYFIGRDSSQWHTNVPLYSQVNYRDVYPGVDLSFHGAGPQLEFDYIVAPGANAKKIALGFEGADAISTNIQGDLMLTTPAGSVEMHKPVAYQEGSLSRQAVDARFVVNGDRVEFALGPYDHNRELIIDPTVVYSTYFGGTTADYGYTIAADANGNAYVAGATDSDTLPGNSGGTAGGFDVFVTKIGPTGARQFTDVIGGSGDEFPGGIAVDAQGIYVAGTTNSDDFPTTEGPAFQGGSAANGENDAFAMKISSDGSETTWATYIGGNDSDSALGLAVDSGHNVYVVGETFSANLPVTNFLASGGKINLNKNTGLDDGYIAVLNPTGSAFNLVSYLGGSGGDIASGIALDGSGNAYIAGITNSSDLPTTSGSVQGTLNASLSPAELAPHGSRALAMWLTLPGLVLIGVGVNTAGSQRKKFLGILLLCVALASLITMPACASRSNGGGLGGGGGGGGGGTSDDMFVVAIKASALAGNPANGYIYETYFGGTGGDQALGIAADSSGNAFITGTTSSSDFPHSSTTIQSTLKGTQNAFLVELNSTGSTATYSTYLGGSGFDLGMAIAVDSNGAAYITGQTSSSDFPTRAATQTTFGGSTDAFVSVIPSGGGTSLTFSTFLGGSGDEDQLNGSIALDGNGQIHVTGDTDSGSGSTTAFPTKPPLNSIWSGSGNQCQDSSGNAAPCPDGFVTAFTAP